MKTVQRIIRYVKNRLYGALVNLSGFVMLICLYIVKPFKDIKLCLLHYDRIGHLAGDTDLFLRRLQLKNIPRKRMLYVGISGQPANRQLLKMFQRIFPIVESTRACDIINSYPLRKSVFYEAIPKVSRQFHEFSNTEVNLHFTEAEEDEGRKLLKEMGIDDNAWFICFHSRDTMYLSQQWNETYGASVNWGYQDFRDCSIENYLEAAKYITSLGGYAVRMGYGVAKELPETGNPGIIDYASRFRTDFGDIYLPAKCKFFLGNTAGLYVVATIFHVPVAWANAVSLDHAPIRKGDLYIPKKVWSTKNKRFLTFREIMESEISGYVYSEQYVEAGLEVVENTPPEILDLAMEMNGCLDGDFEYTEEDEELQNRFRSMIKPHHYAYGSPARIGARFLRQNRELLN